MHGIKLDDKPGDVVKREDKNEMNKKAAQQVMSLFGARHV